MSDQDKKRSNSIENRKTQTEMIVAFDAIEYYRTSEQQKRATFMGDLVGECYLGVAKLLQTELRQQEQRETSVLQKNLTRSFRRHRVGKKQESSSVVSSEGKEEGKYFEEQVWMMGKVVGEVKGRFLLGNVPVLAQMNLGVLTETGIIMNFQPVIKRDELGQGNEKIERLTQLVQRLSRLDAVKNANRRVEQEKTQTTSELIMMLAEMDPRTNT